MASPRGLVPAVEHAGFCVNDSQVVCEYLADVYPGTLLPTDAQEKARVRIFWEHVSSQVIPFFYRMLMGKDEESRTEARDKLLAGLRHANDLMSAASPSGCFLGPGRYSLADLALSPWWFRIPVVLGTYRQFRLPDEGAEFARLRSWWGEVSERASFKRTLVSEDRLVRNYAEYADGSATSEVARTLAPSK